MVTIVHGADFHLDTPFRTLTVEQAAVRRGEQRTVLAELTELTQKKQADLVLLSGDLLDGARVYRETAEALAGALEELAVPVFIAPGNHDHWASRSPYAARSWPGNVHIFSSEEMTTVAPPGVEWAVHGWAFTGPFRDDDPLAGFRVPEDGRVHFLCAHGDVGQRGSRYAPIDPVSLARSGLHYAALGHVHQYSGMQRAGATDWAYPGCPEGRGFDETGPKGVLWGKVDRTGAEMEFVPLCRRQYRICNVDLTDAVSVRQAVLNALPPEPSGDICRMVLTGTRDREQLPLAELEELVRGHYFGAQLRDETRMSRSIWEKVGEDTLTGLFLRALAGQEDFADREVAALAARFGLAALEGREDCCP